MNENLEGTRKALERELSGRLGVVVGLGSAVQDISLPDDVRKDAYREMDRGVREARKYQRALSSVNQELDKEKQ